LVKELIATNDGVQQGVATVDLEDTEIEVDTVVLDHVVENVTYKVLKPVNTPLGRRRASPLLPP
jgi:hypothetical protein